VIEEFANKALRWTGIPLRSIAAGELGRYVQQAPSLVRSN